MSKHPTWTAIVLALLSFAAPAARADMIYTVTLDTSVLASNSSQGTFAVDFVLSDGGNLDGLNNNTATISNFTLTGGSLTSSTASSTGSVNGDLSSTLTITDDGVYNDFNQQFTPGSLLSFTLDLTTNVSASEGNSSLGAPDEFSFSVYSNNGTSANPSFVTIDITGPNPLVTPSGGSLNNEVSVPAPDVQPALTTPEPATRLLTLLALTLLTAARGWQRRREIITSLFGTSPA
jgi:hypothetical protein